MIGAGAQALRVHRVEHLLVAAEAGL